MLFGEFGDAKLRRGYFGLEGRMQTEVTIENIIVTIYFVGTTFFAQITILNMLIALMSKTFQQHSDNLNNLGKRQKLKLMSEYLIVIEFYRKYLCCLCKRA